MSSIFATAVEEISSSNSIDYSQEDFIEDEPSYSLWVRLFPCLAIADPLIEWSGINALLYYGPTLMRSLGIRGDTVSLLTSGGIGVVQFLAVFPAILLIDKLGKLYTLVIHSASLTDLKEGRLF